MKLITFDDIPRTLVKLVDEINELKLLISTHSSKPAASDVPDKRFTIEELANYLGCSTVTINRYKKQGLIPSHRINRTVYFLKSEIDQSSLLKFQKGRKVA